MLSIEFHSRNPFDHTCRTLDVIRKMGFGLIRLSAVGAGEDEFRVLVACAGPSIESDATLVQRLAMMPGITDFSWQSQTEEPKRARTGADFIRHEKAGRQ